MEFTYEGRDKANKKIDGVIEAANEGEARFLLRKQEIRPMVLNAKGKISLNANLSSLPILGKLLEQKVKVKDLAMFTRQFSMMMNSGIPLVQGLEAIGSENPHPTLKKVIMAVKDDVEKGIPLSGAMAKYPAIFSKLYVNLVKAGEASGALDKIFDQLAVYLEKSEAIIKKVKSAMTYPIIIFTVAIAIVILLLAVVVPKFQSFFEGFGAELPQMTQILVGASNFVKGNILYILGGLIGGAVCIVWILKRPAVKQVMDRVVLKLPVLGDLVIKYAVSRFCMTLGILLKSGVPIIDALTICVNIMSNSKIAAIVDQAKKDITEGKSIAGPLSRSNIFPPMVIQMIAIGESSGSLEAMLGKVAEFYDQEVDASIGSATAMLEPIIMMFIAVIVGGVLISLYLPIFKLAGSMKTGG